MISVSPQMLAPGPVAALSRQGVGYRDLTRLFGQENIVLLRRAGRFEPPHHLAFVELVRQMVK